LRNLKLIGLLALGIALGAGAGIVLWYLPESAAPAPAAVGSRTTPLTAAPAPVVDAAAPDFSLLDLNGDAAALSALRGSVVILNFWATWCEPCRGELPLLDRIAADRAGSVAVIGVDADESEGPVRAYAESLGLKSLRILLDPAGEVRDLYLVRGFPTTFFIDSTGVIRRIKIGTLDSSEIEAILRTMGATP
jgi:thiol-disulfide isomerase/thioredoxin